MPSHRTLRMAEAIREVVSQAILHDVSDPRVRGVTVLHVEVSGDLRNATIFISIMGTPAEQESASKGLKSATGFLTTMVAARLQTKSTPVLSFKRDTGVQKSVEMSKLIEETLAADRLAQGLPAGPAPEHRAKAVEDDAPIDDDDEDEEAEDEDEPKSR